MHIARATASRSGSHWDDDADSVTLRVLDTRTGEEWEREVPRERALEAFRHPFLFAPELAAAA